MTRILHCRDLGRDCEFVARAESDDDVLGQVDDHARAAHGVDRLPDDLRRRARDSIRDEPLERHEPPYTTTRNFTAPKFGSAGSGGLEYERIPEQHDDEGRRRG